MPNTLIHGAYEISQDFSGYTLDQIELAVAEVMNIEPGVTSVYVDGQRVDDRSSFVVQDRQRVEWMKEGGEKGIGEVATRELFCRSFRVNETEWEECLEAGLVTASLKHTAVLFVDDGAECLERVRRRRESAPSLDRLNETERAIVDELIGGAHLTGQKIADEASCNFNSYFKATLAALVKAGVIQNDHTGYFMS
ncbi:hypothetical protein [Thalassoroseus pseudoceratinae]|uniref:hypothetical protein n=1 Tax=Thalassoroseus pseudoceratinae TaxID=2713176 RepID=UPI00141EC2EF|nr:hypothetical protein [Thalassoroseus pseudoceratinae]